MEDNRREWVKVSWLLWTLTLSQAQGSVLWGEDKIGAEQVFDKTQNSLWVIEAATTMLERLYPFAGHKGMSRKKNVREL